MELDGAQYFNIGLPFTITQLVWIEVSRLCLKLLPSCAVQSHCVYKLMGWGLHR